MRALSVLFGVLSGLLLPALAVQAQPELEAPLTLDFSAESRLQIHATSCEFAPDCLGERYNRWSVDLLVGLPTAVRIQFAPGEERAWVIEGFTGLDLIFPVSGVGLRRRILLCRGERDSLMLAPGIDGFLLYNTFRDSGGLFGGGPDFYGLAGVDVDMTWRHCWSSHSEGEVGLKLGVAAGGFANGHPIGLPVASFILGFHF